MDIEKVIKGLERCTKHDGSECPQCPYYNGECTNDLMVDALSLLKKQEPMRVLSQRECETMPNHFEKKGICPKCHHFVEWYLNRSYCGFCGQAVKWDG